MKNWYLNALLGVGITTSFCQRRVGNLARVLPLLVMLMMLITATKVCAGPFSGKGQRQLWVKADEAYNAGVELDRKHLYDQAMTKFKEAIHIYPYDPDYFGYLGLELKRTCKYQEAEEAYQMAIKLNGSDWRSWNNLVNLLYLEKKYQRAHTACRNALMLHPPLPDRNRLEKVLKLLDEKVRVSAQR